MVEKAVYGRLSTFSGLTALVGSNVFGDELPEGFKNYPAVTFHQLNGKQESAMVVDTGISRKLIQVNSWAFDRVAARSINQQVRLALQRFSGTVNGVEVLEVYIENEGVDLWDDSAKVHYVALDALVIHRE